MTDFIPSDLDQYPGQPTDEALTWAIQFCKRNLGKLHNGDGSLLVAYAGEYYQAAALAERRYQRMISVMKREMNSGEPKAISQREFYRRCQESIREDNKNDLRNN